MTREEITSQVERYLEFLEDENNYYANIDFCIANFHRSKALLRVLLYDDFGEFAKACECYKGRLERAYKKAIETHAKWIISQCPDDVEKDNLIYSVINSFFNLDITNDNIITEN